MHLFLASFMTTVEENAKGWPPMRKKCEAEAEKLKGKGNVAFKNEKFEEAVTYYTLAISKTHTNPFLYTNRAQVSFSIVFTSPTTPVTPCSFLLICNLKRF